ncbi:MAG: copper chaperone PCu(A)C [Alphaproteobacteria bacterium]|nr:copper chaperone PCu(A)C [Alphaproteobacteria bacterium]MBF0393889.1 copper chaperone PCu(A)C [Alphaproteobacteria bacterium]
MRSPFAALALAATVALLAPAFADTALAANIEIRDAFARATPGMAPNGGAFMTIVNNGSEPDRLVSAAAPVSKTTELHTHDSDGQGVMRMRKVEFIAVPAGGTVRLAPGGHHVMFMGLQSPLKEGDKFPITLTFERAGKMTFDMPVVAMGAMGMGMGMGMGGAMMHKGH